MSDTGKMLLTTVMTVELLRLIFSELTYMQRRRLTIVCKEFYAHKEEVPPVLSWISCMYRDWVKTLGYTTVSKDGEEILYWDNNQDQKDHVIHSKLGDFCRLLFRESSGQLLRKIRIVLKSSKFLLETKDDQIIGYNEEIETNTIFACDPNTPGVFDFIDILNFGKVIMTKLDQPIPNTPESKALSYRTHQHNPSYRLMRPEIMEEPIDIPEDRYIYKKEEVIQA